jgi:hypothetical protein
MANFMTRKTISTLLASVALAASGCSYRAPSPATAPTPLEAPADTEVVQDTSGTVYTSSQVDRPAMALPGNPVPVYPQILRD